MEAFISQHSILIRGVNPLIGVDTANKMIAKVFEERFGQKKVVAVHTMRRTDNVQQLARKKAVYKQRVDQFRMQNNFQEQREQVSVGRFDKVDAEGYYQQKYEQVVSEWETLRDSAGGENIGVAFVSFREKECVAETIDEIDIVKAKLVGKEHYDMLDIRNWEVEQACPTSDIIWHELGRGKSRNGLVKWVLAGVPVAIGMGVVFGMVYVDYWLRNGTNHAYLVILYRYCCPLLLVYFTYYLLPYLVFKVVQWERNERKSEKEESFMRKNTLHMVLNSLILPFLGIALITYWSRGSELQNNHSVAE